MNTINYLISNFASFIPVINTALGAGFLVFIRILGVMQLAPLFNRSEIPVMAKTAFALFLTILITSVLNPSPPPADASIIYLLAINYIFGCIIGYIGKCIMSTIEAGGDMINTQMGLSSAMVMDPSTQQQVSIVGKVLGLFGLLVFIEIGGIYWVLNALIRSFDIFPLYAVSFPLEQIINIDYLVKITSNILYIGLQLASPVLIATLCQDIILGVISKTAPQINVFQLSFLFKPVMGCAILMWVLPVMYGILQDYFLSYANLF